MLWCVRLSQGVAATQSGFSGAVRPMLLLSASGASAQAWFGHLLVLRLIWRDNPLGSQESILAFMLVIQQPNDTAGA